MIMKRKNFILSIILGLVILTVSSCKSDDVSTTTVISSDATTTSSVTTAEEAAEDITAVSEEKVSEASTSATEDKTETVTEEISTTVPETTSVETTNSQTTTAKEATTETTTTTKVTTAETTTEKITTEAVITTVEVTETETEDTTVVMEKKYIALTFDDGPNTTTTNDVLDVLEQYNIKASFFLIGNNINAENESVVKRAHDMGCDIENHSKSHPYMNEMTEEEIIEEVEYVNEYIKKITGESPSFFRPPYIAINNTMYDNIDLTFIAGFGCNDWDDAVPADRRAAVILRQAQDGGIILLHDAQGNDKTVEALHTIIPELQAQGYEFVTISELFEIKGKTLNPDDKSLYTILN